MPRRGRPPHNLCSGILGAGGTGFEPIAARWLMTYERPSAIALAILARVVAVNATGAAMQRRLRSSRARPGGR